MAETKQRHIRISDALWEQAKELAKLEGVAVSEVIRWFLEDWVASTHLRNQQEGQASAV